MHVFKNFFILKYIIITFSFVLIIVVSISCHKNNIQPNILTAKWNIINDSLATLRLSGTNYIGTASDYYNFTSNGRLYIKEDTLQSTATYELLINNQVDIVFYLSNDAQEHRTYNISNLTNNSVTLTLVGVSLGPAQYQVINLKK